jgi:hypothetical protein
MKLAQSRHTVATLTPPQTEEPADNRTNRECGIPTGYLPGHLTADPKSGIVVILALSLGLWWAVWEAIRSLASV